MSKSTAADGRWGADGMVLKVDYYTSLSRAVAGLERDAYAARGAIYDREYQALMRNLFLAGQPHSNAEINQEQRAFRDAVRRIEFGNDEAEAAPLSQRGDVQASVAGRRQGRSWTRSAAPPPRSSRPPWLPRRRASEMESALEAAMTSAPPSAFSKLAHDVAPELMPRRRKSVAGRVFRRALLGAVLLCLGALAYNMPSGGDLPWRGELAGREVPRAQPPVEAPPSGVQLAPTGTQTALLFKGNRPDANAAKFSGTASWQLRSERAAAQRAPAAVVQLDVGMPGRKVFLTMTMRREPAGSAMSHLLEFRFLGEDNEPDPDIANIGPVVMTTAEMTRPTTLFGQVVNVTPGVFLFGLSGDPSNREKNLRNLGELGFMAIPLARRNGDSGLLVIEKGADGDRAINEALRQWAQ